MDTMPPRPTEAETAVIRRRQKGRNLAMMLVLCALSVLFFAISIVKMTHH